MSILNTMSVFRDEYRKLFVNILQLFVVVNDNCTMCVVSEDHDIELYICCVTGLSRGEDHDILHLCCVTGFIPGPILFGWLIDLSCLVWHDKCGEGGSCFFYDNQMMSNNILAIALVAKATASVFTLIAYLFYVNRHPDKVQGEESSDNEGDKALGLSSSHDTGISGISDSIVVPDLPIKVSITDTDRAIVQDGGTTDYIAMTDANTKTDFSTRTNDRTSPIVKTSSDTMIKPDLITQTENMTTAL